MPISNCIVLNRVMGFTRSVRMFLLLQKFLIGRKLNKRDFLINSLCKRNLYTVKFDLSIFNWTWLTFYPQPSRYHNSDIQSKPILQTLGIHAGHLAKKSVVFCMLLLWVCFSDKFVNHLSHLPDVFLFKYVRGTLTLTLSSTMYLALSYVEVQVSV